MRIPVEWLRDYVETDADPEQISVTLTMAGLEVETVEQEGTEAVLDMKVTPNRGDCLSMIGAARELAAKYNVPFKHPMLVAKTSGDQGLSSMCSVDVRAADLCPRYAARVVDNIKIGQSPLWMQKRLFAAGMRPINNVVDVTNYILLELGQPLHAFDLNLLPGGTIVVRRADQDEQIETLDGGKHKLSDDMLVICDANHPVAVAGIMGGAETEVTSSTKSVLLESAHFHPSNIRLTSQRLGLASDSSYRFERNVDPDGVVAALDRACELLQQMGAGSPLPGVVDVDNRNSEPRVVSMRGDFCLKLLGTEVADEVQLDCLKRLEIPSVLDGGVITCQIPSWRADLVQEHDLIEEVGRVYGYENIEESLPKGLTHQGSDSYRSIYCKPMREALLRMGLTECVCHTLRAPSVLDEPGKVAPKVRMAASPELSTLRTSLLPGLVDVIRHNMARRQNDCYLFETANVMHQADEYDFNQPYKVAFACVGNDVPVSWSAKPQTADFYTAKAIVEELLDSAGVEGWTMDTETDVRFHPGRSARVMHNGTSLGQFGELHPDVHSALDIKRARIVAGEFDFQALVDAGGAKMHYTPISKYPAVYRDLAVLAPAEMPYRTLLNLTTSQGGDDLDSVWLVDVYQGEHVQEGMRSMTLSLTYRSKERTLVDTDVDQSIQAIVGSLGSVGASLRS